LICSLAIDFSEHNCESATNRLNAETVIAKTVHRPIHAGVVMLYSRISYDRYSYASCYCVSGQRV